MNTHQPVEQDVCDVLIIGSGPTGLTLARRGIKVRIIEKSAVPFNGSRGKGIQPRTIEVFDNLGVAQPLLGVGQLYPPMKFHVSFLKIKWNMMKYQKQTVDIPYPNVWLVPQWRTEQVLRDRLAELGTQVEWDTGALQIKQDAEGVSVRVACQGEPRIVHARYLVGADGGKSFVRKQLGVNFTGSTSQEGRMIVGDLHVEGLSRDAWHIWPTRKGGMIGLCPLPHSNLFQLMMRLDADEPAPELSEHAIQIRWLAATGSRKIHLHSPTWLSVFPQCAAGRALSGRAGVPRGRRRPCAYPRRCSRPQHGRAGRLESGLETGSGAGRHARGTARHLRRGTQACGCCGAGVVQRTLQ
ncbi:FAD-binding monooxygenase, PheA/TfdB family [Pseudomonas syringae pv. solidagae]|uniref:FAD-binding monooxygenase, PheA/TfdB family n=1 Tax=Pseudomonas syringae pv. solidagae TaxID=264458 RepID=A0A3M5KNI7_PSESX|nr:FAD-binding monooxygenase, PheA/TfdB family [Pseudomonas syringae pv. solidagae]RMT41404.1 FAD-binding monooxygenase, PheA/TfdB family [Pseudomonas syringae pv. solidagae]